MEGWSYTEVMGMPEYDRIWWYEHCKEYNEKLNEEYKKAGAGAKSKKPRRRR